jgi:hypothetical protein
LDYIKQFKQSRDITKSHVGTDILDKFVENTREYQEEEDTTKKKEMKNGAFDKWMAYLLIRNSGQSKYGSLLNGLVSQFSMDNNQYPKNNMIVREIKETSNEEGTGMTPRRRTMMKLHLL